MKPIIIVIVVGVVGGICVVALNNRLNKDTIEIRTAFGDPQDGKITMNAVMNTHLTIGASSNDKRGVLWAEWMPKHFELKDASGRLVLLELRGNSGIIKDTKAGLHEGYIFATLQQGQTYTFDYITPEGAEPKRYRRKFTAPAAAQDMQRMIFDVVEGG
jgi:hypothetical protein